MFQKAVVGAAITWLAGMLSGGCATADHKAVTLKRSAQPETSRLTPPAPEREFRGVWIATVDNIDWPSRKNLSSAEQKAELIALLDRAAQLKLNAVIFQVRPQCDALYPSTLEPWSEFLTGAMGKAPNPAWDPLATAVAEAHKRGLELHAWFNPYRALHPCAKSSVSPKHVSKAKPELVRSYGSYLWLDPGEPEVQAHSLAVVMDVVRRYDVDGIHFDDYFYPYPEKDARGSDQEFPDESSWRKSGTQLSRDDWRRENANEFIRKTYQAIKAEKPWVKFGISPFGIWRPGNPPQIKGFDQYGKLYADAHKWLVNGWADYFAPQLYWPIDPPAQSFPVLLNWWNNQNPKARHIWPGVAICKLSEGWRSEEILRQLRLTEKQPVSSGHILYSMKHFNRHPSLTSALQSGPYRNAALIPAMPWLSDSTPKSPTVSVSGSRAARISWTPAVGDTPAWWVVQYRQEGDWRTQIFPANTRSANLRGGELEAVAVSAVNRAGVISPPAINAAKSLAARE